MAFEITDSQFTTLKPKFVDRKNNPAQVDGPPQWSTDNTDVLSLEPATDGLSCKVSAVGPIGTASITMRADADMGAGLEMLIGTFEVSIVAGKAISVILEPDAPQEEP